MSGTYNEGLLVVTNGQMAFTLVGGLLIPANVKEGDAIAVEGDVMNAVAVITDTTHGEFLRPYSGPNQGDASFIVWHMPLGWGEQAALHEDIAAYLRLLGEDLPFTQAELDATLATLTSLKNTAQSAAVTASSQAGVATTQAGTATTKASEAAADRALALGYRNDALAAVAAIQAVDPDTVVGAADVPTAIAGIALDKAMNPFNTKAVLDNRVAPLEEVVVSQVAIDLVVTDASSGLIDPSEEVAATLFGDADGRSPSYVPAVVLADGTVVIPNLRVQTVTFGRNGGTRLTGFAANYDFAVMDEDGYPSIGVLDGMVVGGGTSSSLQAADLANLQRSTVLSSTLLSGLQQPVADFNSVIGYGQSLMVGHEAWPALSKQQRFANLMLGNDIRPANIGTAGYTQMTPSGLRPLIAQVQNNGVNPAVLLSDAAVAGLAAGHTAYGENPLVGMLNCASWLIGRRTLAAPKPFIGMVPAVGGTPINGFLKVDGVTDFYSRAIQAVTQAHAAATTGGNAGKTHAVTAVVWMQGEYDYVTTYGSTKATKALYKAALVTLRNSLMADIKAITGQTDDPAFILYQTGASYTEDADKDGVPGLHVGMAQLEFALENPTKVFLAGPVYPVTDKGGHLDPNGSRWFGQAFLAKAYYRAVIEQRRWRPLSPVKIEQESARTILVHFHVPTPPLTWASSYSVLTATDYAAKGFKVTDSSGDVPITAVDIVGQTIVRLTLQRAVAADPRVWYAPKATVGGNGNLRDSDPFQTLDNYEYHAATGQYAGANLPALVDKPYPAQNACVAFFHPVGYAE